MSSISIKAVVRSGRVRKDGLSRIYLRFTQDRKATYIDLDIAWNTEHWDSGQGRCMPRKKNDKEAQDLNLVIGDAEAKANDIMVTFRLMGLTPTVAEVLEDFSKTGSRLDFIDFFKKEMTIKLQTQQIGEGAYKVYQQTLRKLNQYADGKPLLFHQLDDFANRFEIMLSRRDKLAINTKHKHHKNVRTMLILARKRGYVFKNPYDTFRVKQEPGHWYAMTVNELERLLKCYHQEQLLSLSQRAACRSLLMVCLTGMRLSDIRRFDLNWIDNDFIRYRPQKTKNMEVKLPVHPFALKLIDDEINHSGRAKMFRSISDQYCNRLLKEVAKKAGIKTNLHYHVGRETFATHFISSGGDSMILKDLLGHTNIITTSKYVKKNDEALQRGLEVMLKMVPEQGS